MEMVNKYTKPGEQVRQAIGIENKYTWPGPGNGKQVQYIEGGKYKINIFCHVKQVKVYLIDINKYINH